MKKLCAYLINGQAVGIDLVSWSTDSLQGNEPFVASGTTTATLSGYTDISSIDNWDKIQIMDWSRRRDEIKTLVYIIANQDLSNYSALTYSQKVIAAKYFTVPYSLRVTNGLFTDAQDKLNWAFLLTETKISREGCTEAMRKHVGDYIRTGVLTLGQTQQFYKDTRIYIQWFSESNLPDLKQWITNEVGSPYETNGFAQTTYYVPVMVTELMNIYNGDY